MAVTPQPLVWDFYREVADTGSLALGSVVHYYDAQSQSIFLVDGDLVTRIGEVEEGHWRTSELDDPLIIEENSFTRLRFDHPSNGTLYGVTTNGNELLFLRYIYSMDLSDLTTDWSWSSQTDSPISQFTANLLNIGSDIFMQDASLFQPGARINLGITMGESAVYPIGIAWLDEMSYDMSDETIDISGRNTIGYFLNDQTFDDEMVWNEGTVIDNLIAILDYAGIPMKKRIVENIEHSHAFIFDPDTTILDGIKDVCSFYSYKDAEIKLAELPDGTICIGNEDWMSTFLPNSHYVFNEGSDVFKRQTSKLSDSSFTQIRVTGQDANREDLIPVTIPINNFKYWALGPHRTLHEAAPDGLTQQGLQDWAEAQADKYQYIGIGEAFVGPFRPNLLVGDIATFEQDGEGMALGVITEVQQIFNKDDGFKTEFAVDSGGVATEEGAYTVYSRSAEVSGFNRRQRIVDMVRFISKTRKKEG